MAAAADAGAIAATLRHLADLIEAHLALAKVVVWDGPWQTSADEVRFAGGTPAALVSLAGFSLDHRARARFRPGQLRAATAGDPPSGTAPGQEGRPLGSDVGSTALAAHVTAEIAVTFLVSDPSSRQRATSLVHLAEAAVPVLAGYALTDIRGSNLYTAALAKKGLAAFVLIGRRDIELSPPTPPRVDVSRVEAVTAVCGVPERIAPLWPEDAG